jgi:hypothetical protein
MKKNIVLFIFSFLIILVSCKKHLGDKPSVPVAPPVMVPRDSITAGINREIASVLEQVYRNDSAYAEVNASIRSEYYADERVLLKDLLYPESSELYNAENFRKFNSGAGIFKRIFEEVLMNGNYPLLKDALSKDKPSEVVPKTSVVADYISLNDPSAGIFSGETAVAIYFPYSANFSTLNLQVTAHATIVAADREANAAPGKEPYYCATGGNGICYKEVTVDDNYADSLPTHIVENGARPKIFFTGIINGNTPAYRVYQGWAKLTRQMDALFSFTGNGGGSEIKVARLSGYLKIQSEQVTGFSGDVVTLDFSRSDIRNGRWKRVYSIWDANWPLDNTEQVYAVYEDDTKGTRTFSGSLNTTVTLPGKLGKAGGEVSYKIEAVTQDEIITQRKLDRESFFRQGMDNQGWGYFKDVNDFLGPDKDWPIYDGGAIWQYSMGWKIN